MVDSALPDRTIGYLSGAPRVSTHPHAAAAGPRTHVLGVIRAFETLGWEVRRYIAGDVGMRLIRQAGEEDLTGGWIKRAAIDLGRLGYGRLNRRKAFSVIGTDVTWVYERFASFQSLGVPFRRAGIPWILETQGPSWQEALLDRGSMAFGPLARRLEINAYRSCDVLVCVTDTLKDILVREANLNPGKVVIVPNGVDLRLFDPERTPTKRLFEDLTIVFVGILLHWHRLDLLIDALADLRGVNHQPPLKLVIVGDGPERTTLQKRVSDYGMGEHVRLLGRVPMNDVPHYLRGADIGFIAYAGSGQHGPYGSALKLYEYLAMGLPVLAARIPETERIVREGETGFLFEPGDSLGLRHALLRAMQRRDELIAMGNSGRGLVEAHSWSSRVEAMVAEVRQILTRDSIHSA